MQRDCSTNRKKDLISRGDKSIESVVGYGVWGVGENSPSFFPERTKQGDGEADSLVGGTLSVSSESMKRVGRRRHPTPYTQHNRAPALLLFG